MAKQAGRPKITDDRDLISYEECGRRVQEYLGLPVPWAKGTIKNKVAAGEFDRWGSYHHPLVDWNQVKRTLHWRKKVRKVS